MDEAKLRGWLNFFFPQFCIFCRTPLEKEASFLCSECSKILVPIHPQKCCRVCGASEVHTILCQDPFRSFPAIVKGMQVWQMRPDLPFLGHRQKGQEKKQVVQRVILSLLDSPSSIDLLVQGLLVGFLQRSWPLPDLILPTHGSEWSLNASNRYREKNFLLALGLFHCLQKMERESSGVIRLHGSCSLEFLSGYAAKRKKEVSTKNVFWVSAFADHENFMDWAGSNEWSLQDRHFLLSLT